MYIETNCSVYYVGHSAFVFWCGIGQYSKQTRHSIQNDNQYNLKLEQ